MHAQRSAPAAAAAELLLAALRMKGERAGHTLRGVPDAQLDAAAKACGALCDSAEFSLANAPHRLKCDSGLWTAALQVYGMALHAAEREPQAHLDMFVRSLCGLLAKAAGACEAVLEVVARAGGARGAHSIAVFGARLSLALLEGDALQAHARILAQRYQQLRSALQPEQGTAHLQGRALRLAMVQACHAANAAGAAALCTGAAVLPLGYAAKTSDAELCRRVQAAFIRALHASNVLEHLARLRLELHQAQRALHREGGPGERRSAYGSRQERASLARVLAPLDLLTETMWASVAAVHHRPDLGMELVGCGAVTWPDPYPHLRLLGGADGRDGTPPPLLLQLRSLARQPCLQLYAGWRLAAHLCHEAGAPQFGMPDSLMLVGALGNRERWDAARCAAILWAWALWAPAEGAAEGAAAAQGGAPQPLPPLPYKPVHMVRLLCGALPAGEATPRDVGGLIDLLCYRALLHHPMPAAEAEAMLRHVWAGVVASLQREVTWLAPVTSRLLRLSPGSGDAAGAAAAAGPAPPLPLSLRCALEAGLLRGLEGRLRRVGRAVACGCASEHEVGCFRMTLSAVDLLLRRPGVWPALLAHAPPRQVAALVVTLRKAAVVSVQHDRLCDELCQHQLAALLEQATAAVFDHAHSASSSPGTSAAGAAADACRSLPVNRLGADEVDVCDGEAARAPPSLALLAQQGGCPAPGSPAAQQQRTLAVFAAAQWLPELLIAWCDQQHGRGVNWQDGSSRDAHRKPLLCWLRVAAEQCLHARWAAAGTERELPAEGGTSGRAVASSPALRGSSGGPAHELRPSASAAAANSSWRQLVCCELILQRTLLFLVSAVANPTAHTDAQLREQVFDLVEVVVAAMPEHVAEALLADPRLPPLVADGPAGEQTQQLLQRQGRRGLWAALHDLNRAAQQQGGRLPPDWQPPEQLLADAPHLRPPPPPPPPSGSAQDWAPLPPPCEAAAVLPLCSYPSCESLDGESEADATLRACAQCRTALYCSQACLRAHWAAGHEAECTGASARG